MDFPLEQHFCCKYQRFDLFSNLTFSDYFLKVSIGQVHIMQHIPVPEKKSLGPLLSNKESIGAQDVIAIDDKTIMIK